MNFVVTLHRFGGYRAEHVRVYNLPEASETVLAYQRKHGMAASDMGSGHGDVLGPDDAAYKVSYNGRVWSKDDEGDFAVLEYEPVHFP